MRINPDNFKAFDTFEDACAAQRAASAIEKVADIEYERYISERYGIEYEVDRENPVYNQR